MNKQSNMKGRQRGRPGGKPRPQGGRNPNFDGGGNNNRMRGNAQQLLDKYLAMARDAFSAGDRVLAENYYQHADHYYRVVNARLEQQGGRRPHNDERGGQQGHSQSNNGQDNRTERGDQPSAQPGAADISQGASEQVQPAAVAEGKAASSPTEADIGLPPGLLGAEPSGGSNDDASSSVDEDTASKAGRARQPARRRRSRSDKPPAAASAGE
jgi:hypothetical protein